MREIKFKITNAEEGAAFAVHIIPKSIKNEVVGKYGDALKIRLTASTAKGTANDKLIDFISKKLSIEPGKVEIAAGQESAEKMVVVVGMTPTQVESLLLS